MRSWLSFAEGLAVTFTSEVRSKKAAFGGKLRH
jgi:hypothetical protein